MVWECLKVHCVEGKTWQKKVSSLSGHITRRLKYLLQNNCYTVTYRDSLISGYYLLSI